MKMNTKVVFTGIKQVQLQQEEIPAVGDDEILVRNEASLISTGTELTCLEANVDPDSMWATKSIKYPMNPGYSMVGRIVAAGKNVPTDYIGKRIMYAKGHAAYHVLPAQCNDKQYYAFVPDSVSSVDATFTTIGLIVMASIRVAKLRPGEVCVVFGAGLIGQFVARLAKLAGATTVMVTDVSDHRLDLLPKDPCFVPFNSAKGDPVQRIKELTGGRGADVVFETTSIGELIQQEMNCLAYAQAGRLIITSSPKHKCMIDLDYVSRAAITIIGANNVSTHIESASKENRWCCRNDQSYILELMDKKLLDVSGLVTHTFHGKDADKAYEMLMADRTQAMGVILNWEE